MNFLNENMEEVLLTLDGEKMYVETIFREKCDDEEYKSCNIRRFCLWK